MNKSVVTLTLGSGAFESSTYSIWDALTVSGIAHIFAYRRGIVYVSDKVVTIELTFKGSIDKDTILTFTLGADAIKDYNGPALTAELPVTVSTISETPTTTTDAIVSISPVSVASPAIGQQIEFMLNITGGEAVAGYQANRSV